MTLTKHAIVERLNSSKSKDIEPIFVTPILDIEDQVGVTGVDVRLGKQFIVFKQHQTGTFSPLSRSERNIFNYQEEIVIPIRHDITLHPGQLIIGCTLEYVSIPSDLECQVEGRSSWARLGLMIATATTVEPGYKGVITLELSNSGTIPIRLFPGLKIAQLIFHECSPRHTLTPEQAEKKKYNFAIGPGLSKVNRDKYLNYFCRG
jgi:dCTP deaminase